MYLFRLPVFVTIVVIIVTVRENGYNCHYETFYWYCAVKDMQCGTERDLL